MGWPGDEMAAGARGGGRFRASHADREQVIDTLKAAFVRGMLGKDEFDLRVSYALVSGTYAELELLTADLAAGLAAAQPPVPDRARRGQPVLRPGQAAAVATAMYAGVWVYAFSDNGNNRGAFAAFFLGALVYMAMLAVVAAAAVENRRDKRSAAQGRKGQLPGAGGLAIRHLPPPGLANHLPSPDRRQRHTAEAAPGRRPRPVVATAPASG
jgi:hypothetical protein